MVQLVLQVGYMGCCSENKRLSQRPMAESGPMWHFVHESHGQTPLRICICIYIYIHTHIYIHGNVRVAMYLYTYNHIAYSSQIATPR